MSSASDGSDALEQDRGRRRAVSLVPAWSASVGRFESDALVVELAPPVGRHRATTAHNKKSTLLGLAPPDTIAYCEVHDAGAAITALARRFRTLPEMQAGPRPGRRRRPGSASTGSSAGGATRRSSSRRTPPASSAAASLIAPTDAAAAKIASPTRSVGCSSIGGGQAGFELRRRPARPTTITVVDFSGAPGTPADLRRPATSRSSPSRSPTRSSSSATARLRRERPRRRPRPVAGGRRRVSRAPEARRRGEHRLLVPRRARARELVRGPHEVADDPREVGEYYERSIKPFLLPFDAVAASIHEDGDLDRGSSRSSPYEALDEPAAPAPARSQPRAPDKEESTWQSESG